MEISEAISLINLISKGFEELKTVYETIPLPIFLPPAKAKLLEAQQRIDSIESDFSSFKTKIGKGFPELARLVRFYSRLISDVRIAGILADKTGEIYGLIPELSRLKQTFTNERQGDYSRVSSSVGSLTDIDAQEKGQLEEQLRSVRDLILELKNVDANDTTAVVRLFDSISTKYRDMETTLSKLIDKVLKDLETSFD
ncbi:hypothetical protein [Almyronema epifaneia]|uniref:Uncharacterized protein n=1 Tax=Almyronema epifaneia S1 TaxID=2991925 RepID=A0ABW6IDY4_9CYAN